MKKQTITIKGMHCKSCELLLTDVLGELPGMNSAAVSLAKNNAVVEYDEKRLTEKQIKDAIKKEGYTA